MTDQGHPVPTDGNSEVHRLLRQCVQCGLCLPHCATWLATGNEVQSPRGRLILLGAVLEADEDTAAAVPDSFLEAFDQCIGCRACETACPSGVPFSLLELGRKRAMALPGSAAGSPGSMVPGAVLRMMDRPVFLGGLAKAARAARGTLTALAGKNWRGRLANGPAGIGSVVRLLGSVPKAPPTDRALIDLLDGLCGGSTRDVRVLPQASKPDAAPVVFFTGCANAGMLAATSQRLQGILEAAGCRLEEPSGQECCGALAAHTGRPGRAARLRRRNRQVFADPVRDQEVILTEAAGCGHELQQYGADFAASVTDAVVFLADLDLPALGRVPLKVAYHDPCHALHGQGIYAEPRRLLGSIPGVELVEPEEPEVCCGSGGAWGLRHRRLSEELGLRKARNLAATGADLVVTANPGCLGQIADALLLVKSELPILPLTDLVWYSVLRGQKKRAE